MVADLKYLTPDELKKYYELRKAYDALVPTLLEEVKSGVTESTETDRIAYQKLFASYELIEIAEKREIEHYSTDIESMMKGAIIQLHRAAEQIIRNLDSDFVMRWDALYVIPDFEKSLRSCVEPFETYISQYPDYVPKFEEAIKSTCEKYPSQMIVIEKEYDMLEFEVDFTETELGSPIMETKHAFIYAYQDPHKIWDAIDGEDIFDENTPSEIESRKKQAKNIKRLDAALPTNLLIPLDKVNSTLWNGGIPIDGKPHRLKAESSNDAIKGVHGNIIVTMGLKEFISENHAKISITVDEFDENVWNAIANAAYYKKKEMTPRQIHQLMGGKTRANKEDCKKIIDSIMKMLDASIQVDTREEAEKLGYNYPKKLWKANLINAEIVVSDEECLYTAGGQAVDCIIRIGDVPRLFSFAIERKQYSTVPLEALQTPLRLTPKNLKIRDYVLKRLCRATKGTSPKTILISTICENCGINDKKSQSRIIATLSKLLNHYKKINFIKDYKFDGDKIVVLPYNSENKAVETTFKKKKKK